MEIHTKVEIKSNYSDVIMVREDGAMFTAKHLVGSKQQTAFEATSFAALLATFLN